MKAFKVSNDCTFVSKEVVLKSVSPSTVNNGISLNKKGESSNWAHIEILNGEYVLWESLSNLVKSKIGDIQTILADAQINDPSDAENKIDPVNDVELILDLAFTQNRIYRRYFQLYEDRYFYSHEVLTYSQMHAIVESILTLKADKNYSLQETHQAVTRLSKKRALYNFKVGSFKYFKDKLVQFEKLGIESLIIHGNKHKPKENVKLTPFVKKRIIKFYIQTSPRLSYKEITKYLNDEIFKYGYPTIDLSTTKKFLGKPDIQNRFKPFRLGKEWAKKYLDPFLIRSHPPFIHDKWEIDGTVLPFYVLIAKKVKRLWLCIIVEVHSRKIIGYGVDYHETSNLIFNTYRMAISCTGYLAFEIVRDNAKAFDSRRVCELETQFETEEYGCFVRKAKVGNPRDKGTVEKTLDILNTDQFSKCEGWIGDPWHSERELYRLESAEVKELRKKVNIKDVPTVLNYVETAIANLNNKIF